MKFLSIILLLTIHLTLNAQSVIEKIPFVDGKVLFDTIIHVNDANAEELFSRAKLAISGTYKSGKAVIDVADDESKYIVVKGIAHYPLKDWLGTVDQAMEHTIKLQFKDGKTRISFTDLVIHTVPAECIIHKCEGRRYPQKTRETHAQGIIGVWNEIKDYFEDKLQHDNDDW